MSKIGIVHQEVIGDFVIYLIYDNVPIRPIKNGYAWRWLVQLSLDSSGMDESDIEEAKDLTGNWAFHTEDKARAYFDKKKEQAQRAMAIIAAVKALGLSTT